MLSSERYLGVPYLSRPHINNLISQGDVHMKGVLNLLCVCAALMMCATPGMAQTPGEQDMQILAEKIKADKKLFVSMNMDLTEKEGKEFWPFYDAYQIDIDRMNEKLGALISEYADAYNKGSVPNEISARLIKEVLRFEAEELKLKIGYMAKIGKVLPATKVARYLQIENKIRAIIKFGLAADIPLIH